MNRCWCVAMLALGASTGAFAQTASSVARRALTDPGTRCESAVRVALGSSAGRLFGHILREAVVLATLGGGLGLALAWWASAVVAPPANVWAPRNFYGSLAPFDGPAFSPVELGFGIALVVVTAMLVALPPAMSAFRIDVSSGRPSRCCSS